MKEFEHYNFQLDEAVDAIGDFKSLLDSKAELEEDEILGFFKAHMGLVAWLGPTLGDSIVSPNRVAREYDLWGDFRCDYVVGEVSDAKCTYCVVEFENAMKNSLFVKKPRTMTYWSPRLESGIGQAIDWFRILDDMASTESFKDRFGSQRPVFSAAVVVGRDEFLTAVDRRRLEWRQEHALVRSQKIRLLTFDSLLRRFVDRCMVSVAEGEAEANSQFAKGATDVAVALQERTVRIKERVLSADSVDLKSSQESLRRMTDY